jgi:hypothetical protein
MDIAIFTRSQMGHQRYWADAFDAGLRKHGLIAKRLDVTNEVRACDLAVMWSHRHTKVIEMQNAEPDRDYLVMECGYLGDRLKWTSLGFNGLNGRAEFPHHNMPDDRWKELERLGECKFEGWPYATRQGYVLILGQVPGDASVEGVDLAALYDLIGDTYHPRYEIRYRPHPLGAVETKWPHTEGTLAEDLAGARFAVTFNSNSCVDATLAGVPCLTLDEGAMSHRFTKGKLGDVPQVWPRHRWLADLAYCQWNYQEIASGEAWEHLCQKF